MRAVAAGLAVACGLFGANAVAQGADTGVLARWSELAADGTTSVRAVTSTAVCPALEVDDRPRPMSVRAEPSAGFAVRVCEAAVERGSKRATVDGVPVKLPVAAPQRIIVMGDSGCRMKGKHVQACNDETAWPFGAMMREAARRQPDLVIHVGDYHYRETPCPANEAGCAGSPSGDGWDVWRADFFTPAAPLLAAAPWVLVRGNHELCGRGGRGWFRLLDPHAVTDACPTLTPSWAARFDGLSLFVLDSADAEDEAAPPAKVEQFARELATARGTLDAGSWLLTHRPVWGVPATEGAIEGKKPKFGPNATLRASFRATPVPAIDLVLSGHTHTFQALSFGQATSYGDARPSQMIVGTGGSDLEAGQTVLAPGLVVDELPIVEAFSLARYGYLVLDRDGSAWSGTFYDDRGAPRARCRIERKQLACTG